MEAARIPRPETNGERSRPSAELKLVKGGLESALEADQFDADQYFLKKITDHELLTPQQEIQLAQGIEKGRFEDKTTFLESNLRLVAGVAFKYKDKTTLTFHDLVGEGVVGLIRAVEKFDYRKGYKFSTYGTWWVNQSIHRALAKKGFIVPTSVHHYQQYKAIETATERLVGFYGREPNTFEIAEVIGMKPEEVQAFKDSRPDIVGLDSPVDKQDRERLVSDSVADPSRDANTVEQVEDSLRVENLKNMLNQLDDDERRVIEMWYGLGGQRSFPIKDIAKMHNKKVSQVTNIRDRAMTKLRGSHALDSIR